MFKLFRVIQKYSGVAELGDFSPYTIEFRKHTSCVAGCAYINSKRNTISININLLNEVTPENVTRLIINGLEVNSRMDAILRVMEYLMIYAVSSKATFRDTKQHNEMVMMLVMFA